MLSNVQNLDTQAAYKDDEDVMKFIRKSIAIAFVPTPFVQLAWRGLKAQQLNIPSMHNFIQYMEETWIAGMFPIPNWNVYKTIGPCTNNYLE